MTNAFVVSLIQIAGMYIAAIMKHGFAFYDNTPPLVLIHTLCKCSSMDFPQTLDLCVTTLCNSADPMLKYSSGKPATVLRCYVLICSIKF